MTTEIKYPEELKASQFRYPPVNPHCAIKPCYQPGQTLTEFCPYHKEMYDFQAGLFKEKFIKKYSG